MKKFLLQLIINCRFGSFKKFKKIENKPKFFSHKYVPEYAEDYFKLPWHERDLMSYFDNLKFKEMPDQPDYHFRNKKVVNFDIIHHECRGDPLQKKLQRISNSS